MRTLNGRQKWVYEEQTIVKFIFFSRPTQSYSGALILAYYEVVVFSNQVFGFGFDDIKQGGLFDIKVNLP